MSLARSGEKHWIYGKGHLISGDKNPMFGKKRPEISELMRNRVASEETRRKISEANLGKSKPKQSEKMKNNKISQKISNNLYEIIFNLWLSGLTQEKLAKIYNVSKGTIYIICKKMKLMFNNSATKGK